jgi:hypothetical protein
VQVWYDKDALLGARDWANGVQMHQEKIREIIEWPTPRNVMELKSFLSICIYYRKFVKGFSELTTPLIDLTKKGAFV